MSMNLEREKVTLPLPQLDEAKGSRLPKILFGSTVIAMLLSLYFIFLYAEEEKTMGAAQKIFYFHVSSAWVAFFAFFITFLFSILFLIKRKRIFDTYAYVSAEIGVVFTLIVLTTGPIWAKSSWNTWWVWEPRLITTLILFFIYIAYIMIRHMDGVWDKKARLSAVFGIIGFVDVPIVFFAIRWWQTKLHPIVFGEGPSQKGEGIAPTMLVALLVTIATFTLLYSYLLNKGVTLENMKIKVDQYKEKLRESIEN
ncbi:cytochrome c biogenesis protein CcsA [Neobacillus cucumis]|uniref:cytochrome c biogenesis protein n=1 Tax=Neobacillus cucumis TaxID=1740721 RepID=UPI0018E02239|nr:cytochrome c biogenesis protein [Neobacillus cucumis]MBI0576293.1 cytochrome c biogenesis protein CcsA [Neobacillus cucumis]WHY90474.1 cytochrome c biogenesis protein [Neobacillus cucumis]